MCCFTKRLGPYKSQQQLDHLSGLGSNPYLSNAALKAALASSVKTCLGGGTEAAMAQSCLAVEMSPAAAAMPPAAVVAAAAAASCC